jgi:hypothetical protein
MVRWVTGGSLAHPPRTQTEADQDRAGAPAARAGKCQLQYDRLRGEGKGRRGRGGGARDLMVVNHTQVLERRSAAQRSAVQVLDRGMCLLWTILQDGDSSGFFKTSARCATA